MQEQKVLAKSMVVNEILPHSPSEESMAIQDEDRAASASSSIERDTKQREEAPA